MDNKQRKEKGLIYHYDDPAIMGEQLHDMERLYQYNETQPSEQDRRQRLLKAMFAAIGDHCHIEPPLHANWGCRHVHFGSGIYCNFNLTLVDDAAIYIDDDCMIAPNVVIATSGHPILPILRKHHYVYNFSIRLGKNVWVGSGVQILPGVTIGDNTVIGAGSVVTNSLPANVVAYGTPCKVVREIGDKDQKYFFKNKELDVWS
ncbi:MAG: sugar O-acetyltransferase [Sporolactobacillus sp.]|jgi:galactoside O-acetyltransferase|nr:sugar O-acetyltransferase [Sporolactobacillus sp.]